ncbi:hypothetical protein CPT_MarsHill_227 [Staphylococcus phage MarsHill]|nr:hypothetical protein CPT_MarsHill_227 [Staphylococcus phage MarsHill]QQO92879.1 hypothetical protein CPT_Madawaska_230 [Staphylococcus phage Madawaska]
MKIFYNSYILMDTSPSIDSYNYDATYISQSEDLVTTSFVSSDEFLGFLLISLISIFLVSFVIFRTIKNNRKRKKNKKNKY